jgi:hypothetical protein
MLNPVQLSNEPELFDALVMALDESDAFESVEAREETDGYGNFGYIVVEIGGRKFSLSAYEVL